MKNRYFSISQLSQITGKDRATLAKRLEHCKPYEERRNAKIYDAHEVLPIIYASDNLKGFSKKLERIEYETAKEKLKKVRIENENRLKQLVSIDEIVDTISKEYTYVKMQLKSIPAKLSKPLSLTNDPVHINELLTNEINTVLEELISDKSYEKYLNELETATIETTSVEEDDSKATAED